MASLSDTVNTNSTSGFDTDEDDLAQPGQPAAAAPNKDKQALSLAQNLKSSKALLEQYADLANDPHYQRSTPPDTQATLQKAIADARSMYDQKTNTNDWLEVAQTLGRAITQYGAAQAGMANTSKYGRDMSNLNFGPGIDYNARNQRALGEYNSDIKNAGTNADMTRQGWLDSNAQNNEEYGRRERFLKDAVGASTQADRIAEQEGAANSRFSKTEANASLRDKMQQDRLQHQDLQNEIKQANKDKQEALAGIPLVAEDLSGDMSAKDLAQLKLKHPRELGAVSPGDIAAAKQEATVPGKFYGTNFDKDKFQQALNDKIEAKYNQHITNLKQSIDSLYNKKSQSVDQSQPQPAKAPDTQSAASAPQQDASQSDRVTVKSPDGVTGSIPRAQLQQALAKGFTQVQ